MPDCSCLTPDPDPTPNSDQNEPRREPTDEQLAVIKTYLRLDRALSPKSAEAVEAVMRAAAEKLINHDGGSGMSAQEPEDWPFCDCGVTLLDGEDECPTCAQSPHGRECYCHECADYWHEVEEQSRIAAAKANRALVCSCGWTGAFIEHHNSTAYGITARAGCEIVYRDPADMRERLVRKMWTGAEWRAI